MDKPITIAMLLLPAFNGMAANAFIDPFRVANYLSGQRLYEWAFLSVEGGTVTASNGMSITDTPPFAECDQAFDFVVVNSSWAPEKFGQLPMRTWLRKKMKQGSVLVGIDTGAFVLAYAGLMRGYRAVVHDEHITSFQELFPRVKVEPVLFVMDRNRLSCSGGLAAVDLALEILRTQQSLDLANDAANYIFKERQRSGEEKQTIRSYEPVGYSIPEALREAIILMERNLEEPLRLSEIAHYAGLSQRQLERLFHKYTGMTPVRYYINARLDRARGLVTQTELSMAEIASACGFNHAEQFTRAYKQYFEITPSKDRVDGRIPFQFR
jgi:AraC family carnitine catabolism transcriptional activator